MKLFSQLFLNPYLQVFLGSLLVTASELLMKRGTNASIHSSTLFGFAALTSWFTWIGILCYIASFISWIYVLKQLPLGIAYALINVVHVTVPIGCYLFLHELISPMRWMGIALVLLGLLLVIQQAVRAEEHLERAI